MRDERKKIMVSFLLGMVTALMLGFAFVYGIRGAGVLSAGKINYYKDLDAQYGKYYKMQKSIRDKSLYSIDKKKRDRYLSQAVIQSLPDLMPPTTTKRITRSWSGGIPSPIPASESAWRRRRENS